MCTCGDKNIKREQHKQQHNDHNFKYLYFTFANHHVGVVLQSSVCHIGGQNCPKALHKSKYMGQWVVFTTKSIMVNTMTFL